MSETSLFVGRLVLEQRHKLTRKNVNRQAEFLHMVNSPRFPLATVWRILLVTSPSKRHGEGTLPESRDIGIVGLTYFVYQAHANISAS